MKWAGYAWALGATAACTLVGFAVTPHTDLVNLALLYLLAVVGVALRFSRGPVVATTILGVAAFDYFFVLPSGTFHVEDPQYLLTFAMMLAVGLTVLVADRDRARARQGAGRPRDPGRDRAHPQRPARRRSRTTCARRSR